MASDLTIFLNLSFTLNLYLSCFSTVLHVTFPLSISAFKSWTFLMIFCFEASEIVGVIRIWLTFATFSLFASLLWIYIMWYPNWVFIGPTISPAFPLLTAFANSGTSCERSAVSPKLPPLLADPGSFENSFALAAKLSLFVVFIISWACFLAASKSPSPAWYSSPIT